MGSDPILELVGFTFDSGEADEDVLLFPARGGPRVDTHLAGWRTGAKINSRFNKEQNDES